jgi:ABC-type lipoprotein release transport system permease subunit
LKSIDPSIAEEMKKKIAKHLKTELDWNEWFDHIFQSFRTWWRFAWKSAALLLLSV